MLLLCVPVASDRNFRHSFEIVQMPANLLEVTGLDTAPAMHKAGLKASVVFSQRGFLQAAGIFYFSGSYAPSCPWVVLCVRQRRVMAK